jgi:hypothetical protein
MGRGKVTITKTCKESICQKLFQCLAHTLSSQIFIRTLTRLYIVDVCVYACPNTHVQVPVHLVSQWLDEIAKCVQGPHILKAIKYTSEDKLHGRCALVQGGPRECHDRGYCPGSSVHLLERIDRLVKDADVVSIHTYICFCKDRL